jgi:hypothetical protein
MKSMAAFLLVAVVVYGGFAFAHWAIDPSAWGFSARAFCATVVGLLGCMAAAATD